MNLNGEHNDVSIMRSRLSNQILASAGLPCSRTSYVKLFINEEYKGLYINVEHIDDEFLQRRFIDDDEGIFTSVSGVQILIIWETINKHTRIYMN